MESNKEDASAETKNSLEESSVTMLDVLQEQQNLEEEYAAVLGGSDEKSCTYTEGPVKRQALYSCLTCTPEVRSDLSKAAGICLACSYRCHENHELVELYTKRNFRCDCPTERLGKCMLNSVEQQPFPKNEQNLYNDNFKGIYCNCKRPYPDPERTSEEEMQQCTICEDWFHLQHLDVPSTAKKLVDVASEMICNMCMVKHSFLQDYTGLALKAIEEADESLADISVGADASVSEVKDKTATEAGENQDKPSAEGDNEEKNETRNAERSEEPAAKRQKTNDDECAAEESKICKRPKEKPAYEKGATFWSNDWRLELCRCTACLEMYKTEKIEYLLDAEDSGKIYEERGKERAASAPSTYEQCISALASIDRVHQVDAILEFNHLKDKLKEFLQGFAESKKVVTEEDVNRFFAEMRNERKNKVGLQYFCR